MKELRFKTNLKCSGCVEKVKPLLEQIEGVKSWEVDLSSTDKLMHLKVEGVKSDEVLQKLKIAGYEGVEL